MIMPTLYYTYTLNVIMQDRKINEIDVKKDIN